MKSPFFAVLVGGFLAFVVHVLWVSYPASAQGVQGLAPSASTGMLQMPRTISVSGEAHDEFAPDSAVVSLSLVNRDSALETAKSLNDQALERLLGVTSKFSITKEDVSTSSVYISPEYNYGRKEKPQLVGHQVSRSLRITLKDLSVQEKFLSALVAAKVDQVNGVEFQITDTEKPLAQLRVKAFELAKRKAEGLAEAAGVKIGQVIQISVDSNIMPVPQPMFAMAANAEMARQDSVAPAVPGNVNLNSVVHVVFALEPK